MRVRHVADCVLGLALMVGLAGIGVALPGPWSPARAAMIAVEPTQYGVTIRRVEFQNSAGVWVPFFEGSQLIDIASVNVGQQAGSLGVGNSLPPGRFVGMRVTINQSFIVTALAKSGGAGAGAGTAEGYGYICTNRNNNGNVTTQGCVTATPQLIQISNFSATAGQAGWEEVVAGETMRKEVAVDFLVSEGTAFDPDFSSGFDLSQAALFQVGGDANGVCGGAGKVCPGDPRLTVE